MTDVSYYADCVNIADSVKRRYGVFLGPVVAAAAAAATMRCVDSVRVRFDPSVRGPMYLLLTALMRQVMQSPPSVFLSICLSVCFHSIFGTD